MAIYKILIMRNLLSFILFCITILSVKAQNSDSLSKEDRQLAKHIEDAKKATEQKQIKPTILGIDDTTSFGGYSYETLEGGKYKEVAKAENWSPIAMPDNAEERLRDYNLNKNIKIFSLIFIITAVLLALIFFYRRRKIEIKTASLCVDAKELLQKDREELEERIRLLKEMVKSKIKSKEEATSDIIKLEKQFHEKTAKYIKDSEVENQQQLLRKAFDKGIITEEEFREKSL